MRNIVIIALAMPVLTFAAQPAGAAYYPWCALYYNTSARVCAFMTYEQCQAQLSGIGGVCSKNLFPPPPPPAATYRRGKPRHMRPRQ